MSDANEKGPFGPDGGDESRWGATWETSRRRFLALAGLGVSAAAVGVGAAGCGTAQTGNSSGSGGSGGSKGRSGTAGDTFFVSGFQWGPPTNFNPLGPSPAWPTGGGQSQLIYETLLRFNLLDGSLQPGLGKELQEKGSNVLVVPLQDGTKWSDGQDLTADDVVYTFELAKDTAVSYSNVWTYLDSVKAVDSKTVQFTGKTKPLNMLPIRNAIAGTYIIPKHIWSSKGSSKLLTDTNEQPVGSGPFLLDKADQTQVALKRNDNYWGKTVFGTPPMTAINHPIFSGNGDADLALQGEKIDASQTFTPQIWKLWENQKLPAGTWLKDKPYYLPGNIPLLQINTLKKGLSNPKVRLAIAYAIDTATIVATAMSSYSDVPQPSLILPSGFEQKFFNADDAKSKGWSYDPKKAISILEDELGCKKGSDGVYSLPDGTRLGPWKIITPTGWTDWNTACEVAAKSLKAVGIDAVTEFPQSPNVTNALQNGNFDMACYSYSGVSPASPWTRFRDAMDSRGIPGAGKSAYSNWGRFENSEVAGLLDSAGSATTDEERKAAYDKLDAIYREYVPQVPLMYRPLEFYEYVEGNWTNFPDEKNPYAPPMWQGAGIQWLFKIKKVSA
ncbi:peptide/nickel transport system substrate-binding protein [Friedmanniella endophytica]|uniref:Peptide/nickel transport system substrate-binding protein n=1 Tax=Microlunatus kandeliicorticis TaxID=1759536 RepID=A0A7W3IQR4_9ACTN|nr:ABC transporter substrate-binding protein [Microlunatus kandeliicorticis]MBA8793490.1 peptide/nickel transport system substrate-binding protein [Microlunatus kandeliicorticis]